LAGRWCRSGRLASAARRAMRERGRPGGGVMQPAAPGQQVALTRAGLCGRCSRPRWSGGAPARNPAGDGAAATRFVVPRLGARRPRRAVHPRPEHKRRAAPLGRRSPGPPPAGPAVAAPPDVGTAPSRGGIAPCPPAARSGCASAPCPQRYRGRRTGVCQVGGGGSEGHQVGGRSAWVKDEDAGPDGGRRTEAGFVLRLVSAGSAVITAPLTTSQ
jgi:hypothetical protein